MFAWDTPDWSWTCDPLAQTSECRAGSADFLHHAQFMVFKSVQQVRVLILTVSVMDIDPLGKISVDLVHLCTCLCFSFSYQLKRWPLSKYEPFT